MTTDSEIIKQKKTMSMCEIYNLGRDDAWETARTIIEDAETYACDYDGLFGGHDCQEIIKKWFASEAMEKIKILRGAKTPDVHCSVMEDIKDDLITIMERRRIPIEYILEAAIGLKNVKDRNEREIRNDHRGSNKRIKEYAEV